MNRLPYDCCRCEGVGCKERETCLRYIALADMGPRTPITDNMCNWESGHARIEVCKEK